MARRRQYLSAEEVRKIQKQLIDCTDNRMGTRLQAVLMYETGYSIEVIQERCNCSRSSLLNWCQAFRSRGLSGLSPHWTGGHNAKLTEEQLVDLARKLEEISPHMLFGESASHDNGQHWNVEDLYRAIKLWYGVVYRSRSSYYNILNRCMAEEIDRESLMLLSPAYSPSD
jgi:transposase